LHSQNIHKNPYDLDALTGSHKPLSAFVFTNKFGTKTINFSDPQAVLHLNKALLKHHYGLLEWGIPENYLCPPIPGRADYIHHLNDLISKDERIKEEVKGLDIGMGANCIYPILGAKIYNWKMTGADIDLPAVYSATKILKSNPGLENFVNIRHQKDRSNIFKGIVKEGECYNFSMCNPPFYESQEAARKSNLQKRENIGSSSFPLNFGGQANELWCNGGEALFVKRMIKESVHFKTQIGWFTSLISQKQNLPKLIKQLTKLNASHQVKDMETGNKKTRLLAWRWKNIW